MLFHEIYSSYFNAVRAIIREAIDADVSGNNGSFGEKRINEIVMEKAFSESILTIPESLRGEWALLRNDFISPVERLPEMPLTTLQKRWLKTLSEDPRIKLFENKGDVKGENVAASPEDGLTDVKPLFKHDDIVYFDRYDDGDPYTSARYIQNFRVVLEALRMKRKLFIYFKGRKNRSHRWECVPYKLEYSLKDDKFRLITSSILSGRPQTINMARIVKCSMMGEVTKAEYRPPEPQKSRVVMEITDERNALERVMLHFSHFAKEAEQLDFDSNPHRYKLTVEYDKEDETEMVIRLLSFGPLVKVASPENIIAQLKNRIGRQSEIQK